MKGSLVNSTGSGVRAREISLEVAGGSVAGEVSLEVAVDISQRASEMSLEVAVDSRPAAGEISLEVAADSRQRVERSLVTAADSK